MPPSGVLISTSLSSPLFSFFTLTLQPASKMLRTAPHTTSTRIAEKLLLSMRRASLRYGALHPRSALRDVRDRDRQMTSNGNLPKQRLHRRHFRDRRIRKRAHVILDLWKIAGQVWIPHRHHRRLLYRAIHQLLQQG